jgi:hypothetical protein
VDDVDAMGLGDGDDALDVEVGLCLFAKEGEEEGGRKVR